MKTKQNVIGAAEAARGEYHENICHSAGAARTVDMLYPAGGLRHGSAGYIGGGVRYAAKHSVLRCDRSAGRK